MSAIAIIAGVPGIDHRDPGTFADESEPLVAARLASIGVTVCDTDAAAVERYASTVGTGGGDDAAVERFRQSSMSLLVEKLTVADTVSVALGIPRRVPHERMLSRYYNRKGARRQLRIVLDCGGFSLKCASALPPTVSEIAAEGLRGFFGLGFLERYGSRERVVASRDGKTSFRVGRLTSWAPLTIASGDESIVVEGWQVIETLTDHRFEGGPLFRALSVSARRFAALVDEGLLDVLAWQARYGMQRAAFALPPV